MAADRSPGGRSAGRALLPLGLLCLVVGVAAATVLAFLSLFLTTTVHAGPVRVTVFLVVAPLAGVTASTLLGRWSDRAPVRRTVLVLAASAGVVGAGLTAVVRNYWVLLGLAATATALATALFPQTFAYARQVLARADPGRAALGINTMRTVFSAAWVGGPPLSALLLRAEGFTAVYAMAATMYAVGALVAFGWLEPIGAPDRPPAEMTGGTGGTSRATLLLAAAAFTALQAPMSLGAQALPLFITDDLHGDVRDAGLLLGLCAALEIPLLLGLGALSARVRLRRLLLVGAACGVGYYALVTTATSLWVLAAGQLVNALCIAAVSGLGISYTQDLLPHRPGQATTMFANTFPIGAMLSGPLLGLAQHFGYRLAYAMAAGLCAIGFTLLCALPRPRSIAGPRPDVAAVGGGKL